MKCILCYKGFFRSFVAVTIITITGISCGDKKAAPQQQFGAGGPVNVTTDTVEQLAVVYYDEYPATVVALNQVELRAQVTGYVTGIYFKDGDKVRKGQRLYSIDQEVYSANAQQAEANVQVQETNLIKAQKDADRYHELEKKDAVARQQVDYADAALEAAKKQVDAARAQLRAVRSNVGFANITAPFNGTIGISQVRTGTSVVAGQTVLNTVSTDNPIAVDFVIGQEDVYRYSQLLQSGSKIPDSTFTLSFAGVKYPKNGKLLLLDRAVDPQTGTIKARLSFPNDEHLLKSGMTATVRVLNNAGIPTVVIPYKAVTEMLGEYFVYVVGDSSKVSQRKIQLGRQLGGNVIVKNGLEKDEEIVVQGIQNLREGAVVTKGAPGGATGAQQPQQKK